MLLIDSPRDKAFKLFNPVTSFLAVAVFFKHEMPGIAFSFLFSHIYDAFDEDPYLTAS